MRPHDSVILLDDLSDELPAGTTGAIVASYGPAADVVTVEWFDKRTNHTIDVVDVRKDQIIVTLPDFYDGERVAALTDDPKRGVRRGQVGTIVRRTGVGLYVVDFGEGTRATLHAQQILLLHEQPTPQGSA